MAGTTVRASGGFRTVSESFGLPIWLFRRATCFYNGERSDRVWRFGSRRPLRFVLTVMTWKDLRPSMLFAIGKAGVQFGPLEAVWAGHSGLPAGSKYRAYHLGRGWGLGFSWDGPW